MIRGTQIANDTEGTCVEQIPLQAFRGERALGLRAFVKVDEWYRRRGDQQECRENGSLSECILAKVSPHGPGCIV